MGFFTYKGGKYTNLLYLTHEKDYFQNTGKDQQGCPA